MTEDALEKRLREGSERIVEKWTTEEERKTEQRDAGKAEATSERLRAALEDGGRAVISVRSKKTGAHVSIRLAAKKKKAGGRGWVSRGSRVGRVGIAEADAIFADDPTLVWPEGKIGIFDLHTGEWKRSGTDSARVWATERALMWALGSFDLSEHAEIFIELRCSYCGHALRDPVSIERGVGPECAGSRTGSRAAERS